MNLGDSFGTVIADLDCGTTPDGFMNSMSLESCRIVGEFRKSAKMLSSRFDSSVWGVLRLRKRVSPSLSYGVLPNGMNWFIWFITIGVIGIDMSEGAWEKAVLNNAGSSSGPKDAY